MNIIIYFLVQQHLHGLYGISACPNSFEISKDSVFGEFGDRTTGKSFSEALILESTNPQYDKRLFIELPENY